MPGVASFVLADGDAELIATTDGDEHRAEVVDAYLTTALPFVLQARGHHEAIHASAVLTPVGSVAGFCGQSESGKSTIAFALAARGYRQWADDALVFSAGGDGVKTLALPFTSKLRDPSAEHFGVGSTGAPEVPPSVEPAEARLACLLVIEPVEGGMTAEAQFERLGAADALRTILPNAFRFRPDSRKRRRQMLSTYLHLAAEIPVWQVQYPAGLEHLEALLDAIDRRILA